MGCDSDTPVTHFSAASTDAAMSATRLSRGSDRGWPRTQISIFGLSIHPHVFGLLLVAMAAGLTRLHESFIGPSPVFGLYYLAIGATALIAGTRSAIYAVVAAMVAILVFLTADPSAVMLVHVGLFLVVSASLVAIVHHMHKATREWHASDQRVSNLLSSIDVLAQILDREGRILYCNPRLLRLTGRTLGEMLGRRALEFFAPRRDGGAAQVPEFPAGWEGLAGGWPAETELTTTQGARRIVQWHGALLRSGSGEITGLVTIGIDVTERREAEAAQRHLAAVVEGSEDAIFTVTFDGTVTSWNPAAEKMFGYSAKEMMGRSALLLVPPELQQASMANRERLQRGEHVSHVETVRVARDGRRIDVALTLSPLRDGDRMIGAAAMMRDIGRQKKAEAALRELTRQLLIAEEAERSRIAKELHDSTAQSLVAVMMRLESLREAASMRDANEAREIEDCLAIFESAIHELRTLAYVLHPARLDEDGLVGAIQHYTQGFSERTEIAIALDLPPDFGRVSPTIELVLFRLVQEALSNIYRHSRATTACIRLERSEDAVRLTITDTGIGMPLDAAGKPVRRGVGIAGMEERVRQVGGQFTIESGPDGTTLRAVAPMETRKT